MPHLSFRLTNKNLIFTGAEQSDEWECWLNGQCERGWNSTSFIVRSGDNLYDGFGAEALVHVKKRPPRGETLEIPTGKPFENDDEYLDIIYVRCPDSKEDKPFFEVNVSLPIDAYQRLIDADWRRETLMLSIETKFSEQVLIYSNHPSSRKIEWLADKQQYVFLEKVKVHFLSSAKRKSNESKEEAHDTEDTDATPSPLDQILTSVERATESVGDLRSTIIRAAWVLATVLLITAFTKSP